MANWEYEVPDDLLGLTIEEAKKAIRGTKARLTDKDFSFDVLKGFRVERACRLKLVASSKKRLNQAWFWIREAARKKSLGETI